MVQIVAAVTNHGKHSKHRHSLVNQQVLSCGLASGNVDSHIDEATQHKARLVWRWVTICRYRYAVLVCNQPLRTTQPPTLSGTKNDTVKEQWQCSVTGRQEFDSRPSRLVLGRVTVFRRVNHSSMSPSQQDRLSLLPSAGQEMSTSQNVVTLCSWGLDRYGSFHSWLNMRMAGKTMWSLVNMCHTWMPYDKVLYKSMITLHVLQSTDSVVYPPTWYFYTVLDLYAL